MNQDFMGQLQKLLADPETAEKLQQTLETLGVAPETPPKQEESEENLQKVKQAYEQVNSGADPRVSLLKALKPYMNQTRSVQLDTAVKFLGLTKISGLLKELQ